MTGPEDRRKRVAAARKWRLLPCVIAAGLSLGGCAPSYTLVSHRDPSRTAMDTFGYRKWISPREKQDVVIIGIHGFCGASVDYDNLGNHLLRHQPRTGLYAYEVRGQGSDPIHERRGDIGDPADWYRDLFAFTQLVKERHPDAKIVWFGESMGALIASHAWRVAPEGKPPCDALVFSSPVVRFKDEVPAWQPALLQVAASTVPLARLSLETLAGGQPVQMTQTSTHSQQAETNSYHVELHTMRLLGALASHINTMNDCAATSTVPTLVLHGEKDFFNTDSDVRGFVAHIPSSTPVVYENYKGAYHLLMYDARRDEIFSDVERWLNRQRRSGF